MRKKKPKRIKSKGLFCKFVLIIAIGIFALVYFFKNRIVVLARNKISKNS